MKYTLSVFINALSISLSVDVLLCHDDELEGRRVAFILYLVPPWESSDGGTLDLFSTDGKYWCVYWHELKHVCFNL